MKKVLLSAMVLAALSCVRRDEVVELVVPNNKENASFNTNDFVPVRKTTTYYDTNPMLINTTLFSYVDGDKLALKKDNQNGSTTYTYQGDFLVKSEQKQGALATVTRYTYNSENKLATISIVKSYGDTIDYSFSYNANGKISGVVHKSNSSHDNRGGTIVTTKSTDTYEYNYITDSEISFKKTKALSYSTDNFLRGDEIITGKINLDLKGNIVAYEDSDGSKRTYTFDDKKNVDLVSRGFKEISRDVLYFPGFVNVNNQTSHTSTYRTWPSSFETVEYMYDTKDRVIKATNKTNGTLKSVIEYTY